MLKQVFTVILFIFFFLPGISQIPDSIVIAYIKSGDVSEFREKFPFERVNDYLGEDSLTPVSFSIINNEPKILRLLIYRGADVNLYSGGLTPLMWAARMKNPEMVKMLLENGGLTDMPNAEGVTALMYAGVSGCKECAELLIDAGTNPGLKNIYRRNSASYAFSSKHFELADYLRLKALEYNGFSSDLIDGPHIEWLKPERIKMKYFLYDSADQSTDKITRRRKITEDKMILKGLKQDEGRYLIAQDHEPSDSRFKDVERIFIFGDIHGNYSKFVTILKNSNVIDENMNWSWGKGHLLLIGDVFDKGNYVTELLWLIKLLQHQAAEAGGKVHLIFGNHEIMNLTGDNRYISDKYFYLTERSGLNYSGLFDKKHELGRWLRSLNTIVIINDILFVHGGISPEVLDLGLFSDSINNIVRNYLEPGFASEDSLYRLIMGAEGPLWYRGYLEGYSSKGPIAEEEVERTLQFYNVGKIVYGHTADQRFRAGYDNRTVCIDVSENKSIEGEQALLFEKGKFFKVYADGKTEPLF